MIEPPTTIEYPEDDEKEETEEKEPKLKGFAALRADLDALQYDFSRLRKSFSTMEEKITDSLMEIRAVYRKMQANAGQGRLAGYTIKELAALKAMGISPKDILTGKISLEHGEETQREEDNSNVQKMRND